MTRKRLRIGIIGCGTIGSEIARACQGRLDGRMELAAICDTDAKKAAALNSALNKKAPVLELKDLMKKVDLIVEAASAAISAGILKEAIGSRKDIMIMSVGGLLGNEDLLEAAEAADIKVYLPSGAICGIDGLKSASAGKIDSVMITTRKPSKALAGAPYLAKKGIDIMSIKEETIIFEGTAEDAVKAFPANINVCAVLSLAGLGAKKTRVRVVTAPDYTRNTHEIEIEGSFGKLTTRAENLPSQANPKTSELAILSAIATLEGIAKNIKIGT